MIEAPEACLLCEQLNATVCGKQITDVYTLYSPHKFTWFNGDPEGYAEQLTGKKLHTGQEVTRQAPTAHRI